MSSESLSIHTLVIGAGPSGLAVGACLSRAGVPALILEQAAQVGDAWRHHYDRLHLHTNKARSGLPFAPFGRDAPRYPSRLQVIEYLEDYTRRFALDIRFGQRVASVRREGAGWVVRAQDSEYRAASLVIATGYTRQPYQPHWPGQDAFKGELLHSAAYRSGAPFKGRRVLVVGYGNSGGEIAVDLVESGANVGLAVRGPINVVPRDLLGIPILAVAAVERWLPTRLADAINGPILDAALGGVRRAGLRYLPYGALTGVAEHGRVPLIDVGTIRMLREGKITLYPGLERFTGSGVVFTGGVEKPFDAVILATGFRARVDAFLEGAAQVCDAQGLPLVSGRESSLPGLYFCGFAVSPRGMLSEISREAQHISAEIARKQPASPPLKEPA